MAHLESVSDKRHRRHALLRRLVSPFLFHIRGKIIAPYFALTFVVALIGIYVVTRLVAGSLEERLDNHLLESARAVLNSVARQELQHIETAQLFGFTRGLAEALEHGDTERLLELSLPLAATVNVDALAIVTADGHLAVHLLVADGRLTSVEATFDPQDVWVIRSFLDQRDPSALPQRGIGAHPATGRYYYWTAVPVGLQGRLAGVVLVGTSLDRLLPTAKLSSLADVVIYTEDGQVAGTTFALELDPEDRAELFAALSLAPEQAGELLTASDATQFASLQVSGLPFRFARAPLIVGSGRLAVFAVALPSNFIVDAGATSRNTYVLIFTAAMGAVVLLGYLVAQRITLPLSQLVRTSQAIADGDLKQRTGIQSEDEVGTLARTFDRMTESLKERSDALHASLDAQMKTAMRMRAILASIGDGVLLEDMEGDFIPLNTAAEMILAEMAGQFRQGPLREFNLAEQTGAPDPSANPWLVESRRLHVANKVYTVHSAAVGTGESGRLGTVIVIRDITSEVEAEQLKDAFIAHVSHELRTPLTSIKGYSALLLATTQSVLNPQQSEFLQRIARQTDNLVSMINALLDFSEMESHGRLGLRQRPVDLHGIVESVLDEWRPKFVEKEIRLAVEAAPTPLQVNADADRLRWAVFNLVRNALQYTLSGGMVTVRLASAYDRVSLEVIDTGIGIPKADQHRLFSRFYRVARPAQEGIEERGLGLGLYVTRAIVEAHGGYVQVESAEGVGSKFTVVLPALREPRS